MVKEYVTRYGGSPSGVNADVAEAYSVGQVLEQAVTATGGTDNAAIIRYLHSGVALSTVQGQRRVEPGRPGRPGLRHGSGGLRDVTAGRGGRRRADARGPGSASAVSGAAGRDGPTPGRAQEHHAAARAGPSAGVVMERRRAARRSGAAGPPP